MIFKSFDLTDFKDFFQAITTCIMKEGNTVEQNAAEIDEQHNVHDIQDIRT